MVCLVYSMPNLFTSLAKQSSNISSNEHAINILGKLRYEFLWLLHEKSIKLVLNIDFFFHN